MTKQCNKWIELAIKTTSEGSEVVCARLDAIGVTQFAIEPDTATIETALAETVKYWDFADMDKLASNDYLVKVYLPDLPGSEVQADAIVAAMRDLREMDLGLNLGSLAVEQTVLAEEDWANNWKKNFRPIEVGEKLLIHPSWEPYPESTTRAVVSMDSGMAFGTGEHDTTRMCLGVIEALPMKGQNIADIGCGSGILALSALALGASHAVGVDIDPVATDVAADNASKNAAYSHALELMTGDVISDTGLYERVRAQGPFDSVFANIVAGIVIPLTPLVPALLKEQGTYVVSGIISERLEEVLAVIQKNGFIVEKKINSGDWNAIVAKKQC